MTPSNPPQRWANRAAEAAQIMRDAKPLAYHGQRTGGVPTGQRGHSVDYLASRLRRDHPDIADRVEAGQFDSIRAAAIAAGIVKAPRAAV